MKKLFLVGVLMFLCSQARAVEVWKSSTTATADVTIRPLCSTRGIFHGVCTNFGVASASMTVVASSWSYTTTTGHVNGVGNISTLVADQCKYYDIAFPNGMVFYKNNATQVTIMYTCY